MHNLPHNLFLIGLCIATALSSCAPHADKETPVTGSIRIISDTSWQYAAGIQSEVFSRYYPDASITLVAAEGPVSLQRGEGALLGHAPDDSLGILRAEPVANDALLVIVNSRNPLSSMTVDAVTLLFGNLHPFAGDAFREHLQRVASGREKATLVLRSAYHEADRSGSVPQGLKILAISGDGEAVLPEAKEIMNGSYPLVTTLYYVYYPGDALAAGFGAWLTDRGQNIFARIGLVPLGESARTIILN